VTITAADPGNPPVVTGLDLRGATNLAFQGITFDYTHAAGQPIWAKPFKASGCEGLSFVGCTFDGDVARGLTAADNGFPTGFGLHISASRDVTVADCEISGFYRGLVIGNSDDVTVSGNDVHGIRMDGMNFSAVQGVVIEENRIHDFARSLNSADHSDMIQFWTNGTTRPSTDIVIRNNVLDIGEGHATQSIFMRNDQVDRGLAGAELFYRNVTIEGNVIVNGHAHGITVGETAGLTIRGNSVLHADGARPDGVDAPVEIPRINVAPASTGVVIVQNATAGISGHEGQAGWTVRQNAFVQDQDPSAPGWYGDVFLASAPATAGAGTGFVAVPGGMLDRLDAGAPATLATPLDAAFQVRAAPEAGASAVIFDATVMTGLPAQGATFLWQLGDGTEATGARVEHRYAAGGTYEARLVVVLPDGRQSEARALFDVQSPELLRQTGTGSFIATGAGVEVVLPAGTAPDAEGDLQLGGPGIAASVARQHLAPLFTDRDLSISFELAPDHGRAAGEIVRLNGSFIVAADSRGALTLRAWSSEGDVVTLRSAPGLLSDTGRHEVEMRLEGGRLALWVDGARQAEAAFSGAFANQGNLGLMFGNPWHSTLFEGDIGDFTIDLDGPADPFTGTIAHGVPPIL
jgi:hypothetical protein